MRVGIELEYLLVDTRGDNPGRVRDFTNLPFEAIQALLEDKPGRDDPALASGDLGIRSGYWYLEGDERFHDNGDFRTMAVKGVEIRTPPRPGVETAVGCLLEIEAQLARTLDRHGLGLAIAGFNPVCPAYEPRPPLNAWELAQRRADSSFDGAHVYTLSYGPDINLSMPGWTAAQSLDAARKLNYYSPYIVPFSFSSPFAAGRPWIGWSKRTFERAAHRPAVKLFLLPKERASVDRGSALTHPARLTGESGRIEFKSFDAMPTRGLLTACCYLLEGICLAEDLPGRSEGTELGLYRRAALAAFCDAPIRENAAVVLSKSRRALLRAGRLAAARALDPLDRMLRDRRTPAHDLLADYRDTGRMYRLGGLGSEWPTASGKEPRWSPRPDPKHGGQEAQKSPIGTEIPLVATAEIFP